MKARSIGILSALTASVCCLGPVVLILLGLGGLGIGVAIGRYHWYFMAAGILLLAVGWASFFREKASCDKEACKMEGKEITRGVLAAASIVVLFFIGMNVYTYASEKSISLTSLEGASAQIPVSGMTCFSCEIAVESAVKKLDGIHEVKASAKNALVLVSYDASKTSLEEIRDVINRTGYKTQSPP